MSADPASTGRGGDDPRALATLLVVVFINIAGFGLIIPLLPFYGRAFNATPLEIGALFSAFSLGQLFAEPFWGRLSDRIGRRPVLLATIALNALSYVALAFAPGLVAAGLARLASGFLSGNISTIQGYLADVTPPERRAGRMGVLGSAFSLGFVCGPALGGLLVHPERGAAGFHLPMLLSAGLAGLSALGVLLFLRETRRPTKREVGERPPRLRDSLRLALTSPVIWRVLLTSLIVVAGFAGIESVFGLWSEKRFGWGPREIGLSFVIFGTTSALAQGALTGRLVRAFGETRVLMIGLGLIATGMLVQAAVADWRPAVIGFMLVSLGQSLTFPNISALISRASPPDRQGEMLGVNMSVNAAARIAGPLAATTLFAAVGVSAPLIAGAALALAAIAMTTTVVRRLDSGASNPREGAPERAG